MELVVLNIQGKETGRKVSLDEAIFGIEPNQHAVYLEIKQYLAAQRQGTHKAKERSEITASTKKLKKQKGSGSARYGDIKSPVFKGGGRVFGPKPRDYRFKLNKALKRLAKKSVLSQKMRDNNVKVLEDFSFETPKTKEFINVVNALGLEGKKSLFVLGEANKNVYLSSRNLPKAKVMNFNEISSYDLVNAGEVVFLEGAVEKFQENLRK
ncbi:50S ribosomal protein L4 [Riemerella anatipestifer]|uniref:Large ribosomal subunit protein uL4 n=2 Tax=Riemerella anatipestifer TaxID=34085 RepID=E4TC18_RIEAD|nr:50S ribosomal protein L4 [Riemerella anatipestifer]ADQ82065.1 LSU ribosomal protein L4P [Riemerella anatipestifer ATCC 11845 = DSM 15868]ADZ12435.1 Ribosomal protein L4 [Riemerella anatipestifer RA-GD]AFD56067.1 LSU ribosomal protein l4p [Riemerella anatipestifer ATCC 11845 = DSM 15868]AGC40019.1 Ribosomal protein L4 [Riemerella anatipestifer RA-CH-2]AKP69286.1 50S ribosomal protein l4p [Riemerella anatipestifer]